MERTERSRSPLGGILTDAAATRSTDPVERLGGLALRWLARAVAVPVLVFHAVGPRGREIAAPVVIHWDGAPDLAVVETLCVSYLERNGLGDPLGVPRFARSGWTVVGAEHVGGAREIARSQFVTDLLAPYGLQPCAAMFLREHGRIAARVLLAAEAARRLGSGEMQTLRGVQPLLEHAHACARASRSRTSLGELLAGANLTPRERDVALQVLSGATNQEIARALSIAPATVKTHLLHIYEKLGVQTRAALVATLLMAQSPPPWRFPRTSSGSPSTCTAR